MKCWLATKVSFFFSSLQQWFCRLLWLPTPEHDLREMEEWYLVDAIAMASFFVLPMPEFGDELEVLLLDGASFVAET